MGKSKISKKVEIFKKALGFVILKNISNRNFQENCVGFKSFTIWPIQRVKKLVDEMTITCMEKAKHTLNDMTLESTIIIEKIEKSAFPINNETTPIMKSITDGIVFIERTLQHIDQKKIFYQKKVKKIYICSLLYLGISL